jgi:hypothetical protein
MARLLLSLFVIQLICLATVSGLFGGSRLKHKTKYELQQKVLTLGTSYTIKDDKGEAVYKVKFPINYLIIVYLIYLFRLDLKHYSL